MEVKKNIPLIIGLSIPILMILFVAGSIYLPGLFVHPKFNFLYSAGGDYYSNHRYSVRNGELIENEVEYPKYYTQRDEPKLFIHDVIKNESTRISFEEAQHLSLNSNTNSPDGFEIYCGRGSSGFFLIFFDSYQDCSSRFIKGHNTSKKLNVQLQGGSYYNFQFLGWMIE